MADKQYYEAVPVSELPDRMKQQDYLSINVVGIFNNGAITYPVWYNFNKKFWTYGKGELTTLTHWLRPISLSDHNKEIASKAWDAAEKRLKWNDEMEGNSCVPDKETYINSL